MHLFWFILSGCGFTAAAQESVVTIDLNNYKSKFPAGFPCAHIMASVSRAYALCLQ